MQQREIYHKNRFNVDESKNKLLKSNEINEANKKIIQQFVNNLIITRSIGVVRQVKLYDQLRKISKNKKPFITFDKNDFGQLILDIKENPKHSEATKSDYVLITKRFFNWLEEEDPRILSNNKNERLASVSLYKYIKQIKIKRYSKDVSPSDILTDEDIKEILTYCRTVRERAFIRLLHESGCRVGEFLGIKLKDFTFNDNGTATLYLDGKTGRRRIPLIYCIPYLREYLDVHQSKKPDSYLWLSECVENKGQPLKHRGGWKILNRIWKKLPEDSPIKKKPYNFHHFRHSRATLLASKLTGVLLCKFMGWTLDSKQQKTYVHLCPEDLDNIYFSKAGIIDEKEKLKDLPKKCPVCSAINDSIADYCLRCGKPLSLDIFLKDNELIKRQTDLTLKELAKVMQTPEGLAKLKELNIF